MSNFEALNVHFIDQLSNFVNFYCKSEKVGKLIGIVFKKTIRFHGITN